MAEQRQVPLPGMESPAPAPLDPSATDAGAAAERPGLKMRVFGSESFFQLWLTQVLSSIGDWLGFLAIAALAASIAQGRPEAAIGLVMSARIIPGFFLGAASGVLADRFDRKKLMVYCNLGRAGVLVFLPFVDTILGLVVASLLLECFTLLWAPAKEASVPNLVPAEHLTSANSLSMVAAYGTMPLAAGLFSLLAGLSNVLGRIDLLEPLSTNQVALAFYVNAAAFLVSAAMIARIDLPAQERRRPTGGRRLDLGQAFRDLTEGWRFIFINPVVRAVNLGLATGLVGGGMLVPLGPVFSIQVLKAGPAGFGVLIFALGCGVALGVILLSVFQRHIPKARVFTASVFVAGASLIVAASMSTLELAALFVAILGVCAGSVYVLGFTLLHEGVEDELRGRIFSALYTLVRLCVLIAFAVGPLLSDLLGQLSTELFGGTISVAGLEIAVPGVRLTLWLAGLIIIGAGVLAAMSLKAGREARSPDVDAALDQMLLHEGAELVAGVTKPFSEVKESHARTDAEPGSAPQPSLVGDDPSDEEAP